MIRISKLLTLEERIPFWKQRSTSNEKGCWLFQGALAGTGGYASVSYQGEECRLHVLVWEHFNGPVPEGFELDHLCRNTNCWNPGSEHLEPVTHAVNVARGVSGQRQLARTHCPQGHEYTPENTYVNPTGHRLCRECNRRNALASYNKKKAITGETK